jgi:hypothetical protein
MQANPDNGWTQIESIRLVGFEFEARRATIGGIQISEGAYDDVLLSAYYTDYHIMENAASWSMELLMIVLYFL